MRISHYFLILLIVSGCSFGGTSSGKMIGKLEQEGRPYFDHIVSTGELESLLGDIEEGDENSIRASSIVANWVDASTALSLRFALSRAIVRNPAAVMDLVPRVYSASDLCTIPYIEASMEVELRHVNASISALERSPTPGAAHAECITIYKRISAEMAGSTNER